MILAKDELPLHRTYANAQSASDISGHHILPVMVVYTANASGGASWTDLVDDELLYKHYATFITQAIVAEDVTYGWQINLWAVGSVNWIHQTDDQSADKGQEVANFVKSLDVYTGTYQPDYIVFDKYERDGFGSEAIVHYAYNATSWTRYLSYVKTISDGVESPAMIWQIPGNHMPTQGEGNTLINVEHEASGGSYFMGDARIGTDINNVLAYSTSSSIQLLTTVRVTFENC